MLYNTWMNPKMWIVTIRMKATEKWFRGSAVFKYAVQGGTNLQFLEMTLSVTTKW